MEYPKFTIAELWELEEDARSSLLNRDGALDDPGHWLGLVIDLSRALRAEHEKRVGETRYEFPNSWPSI